jgi:hypothetical protein
MSHGPYWLSSIEPCFDCKINVVVKCQPYSLEAAAPADGERIRRRGYQSEKHSTEDGRERLSFQIEKLKKEREEDTARAAAAAEAEAAEAASEKKMTPEEKAKAKVGLCTS